MPTSEPFCIGLLTIQPASWPYSYYQDFSPHPHRSKTRGMWWRWLQFYSCYFWRDCWFFCLSAWMEGWIFFQGFERENQTYTQRTPFIWLGLSIQEWFVDTFVCSWVVFETFASLSEKSWLLTSCSSHSGLSYHLRITLSVIHLFQANSMIHFLHNCRL